MDILTKCGQCVDLCVKKNQWGNATVKSFSFYECVMPSFGELDVYRIETLLDSFVKLAKEVADNRGLKLGQGSINRNRGEWFELLLFNAMWNKLKQFNEQHRCSLKLVKLPSSIEGHRFWDLFSKSICKDLKNLKLFLANPDFLIIDDGLPQSHSSSVIESFRNGHKKYFGKLNIANVVSIFSVKTTTRPDRRYICVHEAEVIRAMFLRHNSFTPYVVLGLDLTEKDKIVLNSPSVLEIINPVYEDELIPLISATRDMIKLADASMRARGSITF